MDPSVLVLAAADDGESQRVANAVRHHGHAVAWLDLSWIPQKATVQANLTPNGWAGVIDTPTELIDLGSVTAIYYRHTPAFGLPEGMSEPERRFANVEARFGLGGVLSSMPARWASHPSVVADSEHKPVQLAAAVSGAS